MTTVVSCGHSVLIERPADEVRAQFNDVVYHATHPVHPDIKFTVLSSGDGTCRYSQELRIAGMRQVDEISNTTLFNGDLRSDYVAGMNAGGTLLVTFRPVSDSITAVTASLRVPLRGLKALIAPVFTREAEKALRRTCEQDKRDLEAGNYARYCSEERTNAVEGIVAGNVISARR
jgi:hypothetical protein